MQKFLAELGQHEWLAVPLCVLVLLLGAVWGLWCLLTGTEHTGVIR